MRKTDKIGKLFVAWTIVNAAIIVFGVVGIIAIHFDSWISGMSTGDWFGFCMISGTISYVVEFAGLCLVYPV